MDSESNPDRERDVAAPSSSTAAGTTATATKRRHEGQTYEKNAKQRSVTVPQPNLSRKPSLV
jgi:hypothetical protein